jgi:hypothetical protein
MKSFRRSGPMMQEFAQPNNGRRVYSTKFRTGFHQSTSLWALPTSGWFRARFEMSFRAVFVNRTSSFAACFYGSAFARPLWIS